MENLIADGRIHPARIEEIFGKAEKLVNQRVQEAVAIRLHLDRNGDLIPSSCVRFGRLRLPYLVWPKRCLTTRWKFAYLSGVMASELGLPCSGQSVRVLLHDLREGPLTMKSRVAMRSSVPILPVDSAKSHPSCMRSRRITTTSSPTASSTCLCKPPMPFPQHVLVLVRKLWTPHQLSGEA